MESQPSVKITRATKDEIALIQKLDQFYLYEFSPLMPEKYKLSENGYFIDDDYKRYWELPDHFPYLIYLEDEIAGFALVHKEESFCNLDQFFILSKFQGTGLAKKAAYKIFDLHKGSWKVQSFLKNTRSEKFWKKIISDFSNGQYTVHLEEPKHTHNEYVFSTL